MFSKSQEKEEKDKFTSTDEIGHYDNVIIKGKTGPNVKERIEQFGGAAYTPKKRNDLHKNRKNIQFFSFFKSKFF